MDALLALGTCILRPYTLDDEQRGRLIIQLLTDVLANAGTRLMALGANAFGFRNLAPHLDAGKVGRKTSTSVSPTLGRNVSRCRRLDGSRRCGVDSRRRKQD
jgi:hypothetical protein